MPTVPVTDWARAFMTSVAAPRALLGAIPKSSDSRSSSSRLDHRVTAGERRCRGSEKRQVQRFAQRAGISGLFKMGVKTDAAGFSRRYHGSSV